MLMGINVKLNDFLEMDKGEERLEYIEGKVYKLTSPSTEHQRVLLNLATEFKKYFRNQPCEIFIAPLDVWLMIDKLSNDKVQPDLFVICDKAGLAKDKYTGIPNLIVEIISQINESHDRLRKYQLYMNYQVDELWLVNPILKSVEVYKFATWEYKQIGIYKKRDYVNSCVFDGFGVNLEVIF